MKIRTKITLTFFLLVIVTLSSISFAIYLFSAKYRHTDFMRRLKNRATNTAKLLIEYKELTPDLIRKIDSGNPANLPSQNVAVYHVNGKLRYSSTDSVLIDPKVILPNSLKSEPKIFEFKDYEAIAFAFDDMNERVVVIGAAKDVYGFDALSNLRNILITTFLISIVVVLLAGWIYSGHVLRPISKIVSKVDMISEANLDARLDEGNTTDELAKLSQTFNRMLERIQQSFQSQKSFIANASHELRTPIAVMQAEVDAILLQERSSDEYKEVLRSMLEGIKGLNSLSTQLLLLAHASANFSDRSFTEVRIDEILWDAKKDIEKIWPAYKVEISFDSELNEDALNVDGDPQLLKAVFMNLIDNGCKYSDDKKVEVSLANVNHSVVIEFINAGQGIEQQEIEKIFAPFYRGKSSKTVKGYGIGLPLSIRIVKLHHGQLTVQSDPGAKTKFTLTLPLAVPEQVS